MIAARSALVLAAALTTAGCYGNAGSLPRPNWLLDPVQYGQLWYQCHPAALQAKVDICSHAANAMHDYGCLLAYGSSAREISPATLHDDSARKLVDPRSLQCQDYGNGLPPPSYYATASQPARSYQPPYPNQPPPYVSY